MLCSEVESYIATAKGLPFFYAVGDSDYNEILNDLKQHTIDSRIFVYVHRNDNYVKPEAVITGGYFTDTTVFGDLVLSKK